MDTALISNNSYCIKNFKNNFSKKVIVTANSTKCRESEVRISFVFLDGLYGLAQLYAEQTIMLLITAKTNMRHH